MRRSVLLSIHRWNIISAKLISLCPNLECTSMVWAVGYTHAKNGQLSMCITDHPYRRSAFQIRTLSELNLAEMVFHVVRRSFSPPSAAHALLGSLPTPLMPVTKDPHGLTCHSPNRIVLKTEGLVYSNVACHKLHHIL